MVPLDLADLSSVQSKTTEILQVYGHVDILINNAGMTYRGNILETTIDVDQRLMDVNYFGPLALTKGKLSIFCSSFNLVFMLRHFQFEHAK